MSPSDLQTLNYLMQNETLMKSAGHIGLVPVKVAVHKPTGTTYDIRWENPNKVQPTDEILGNHHKLDTNHPQYKSVSANVTIDDNKPASAESKLKAKAFHQMFDSHESFLSAIKQLGIQYAEFNKDATEATLPIKLMRAKTLLGKKIEAGYDPFLHYHQLTNEPSDNLSKVFATKPDVNNYLLGIPDFDSMGCKPGTPYHKWINQTTHYERQGAYMYTCHSRMLNSWLRGIIAAKTISGHKGVSQLEHMTRHTQHMENAIAKFELEDNVTVFRVMGTTSELLKQLQDPNNDFVENAFMSTSFIEEIDPDLVDKFGNLDNRIMLEINIPKGKGNGMYVAPLSKYPDQCEFIIGRGAQLRVKSFTQTGNNSYHFKCDLVGFQKKDLNTLPTMNKSETIGPLDDYLNDEPPEDKWERFIGKPTDLVIVRRK